MVSWQDVVSRSGGGVLSWSDVRAGARDIALVLPGPFSVAMIASVAAVGAGMSTAQAFVLVGVTFAGASQLAALELMREGSAIVVIVVTALMINARFAIFSASLAPHFRELPSKWRWGLGAVLSTPAAVLALAQFADDESVRRRSYYLGAAVPLWGVWQVGVVLGLFLGAQIPEWMDLGFVVTLVFLGLLFPTLRDRPTALAAAVGGGIAVVGAGLPLDLGFVLGTASGIVAGQVLDWRAGR